MRNFLKTFIFIISLLIISSNGFAEIKIANDDYSDLVKFIASYWDVSVEKLIPKTLVLAFDTEEDLLKFGVTSNLLDLYFRHGQSLGKKSKIKNIENYVFVYVDYNALRYDRYASHFDTCFIFHNNKFNYSNDINYSNEFPGIRSIRNYEKEEDLHSLSLGAEVEKQIEIICDEYEKLLKSQHDNFSKYIFQLSKSDISYIIQSKNLRNPSSKEISYGGGVYITVIYKPTNINDCYYAFVFVEHKVYYYEIRGNTLRLDIIAYFNK